MNTLDQKIQKPGTSWMGLKKGLEELKKPRTNYIRLASESSKTSSDSDPESIRSVQEKETDYVTDTSDTELSEEDIVEIEYDVASLSENNCEDVTTSSSEELMIAAAAVAIIYDADGSLQGVLTVTDDELTDSSSDRDFHPLKFSSCIKCKGYNLNPSVSYCGKCFQEKKKLFPPRKKPIRRKNQKVQSNTMKRNNKVHLDTLRSFLSGDSHNSTIGLHHKCPPLGMDTIVIPDHLKNSGTETVESSVPKATDNNLPGSSSLKRKRRNSISSLSDDEIVKKTKIVSSRNDSGLESQSSQLGTTSTSTLGSDLNGLSQDSAIDLNEKCDSREWEKVPNYLKNSETKTANINNIVLRSALKRKRRSSESTLSDSDAKKSKITLSTRQYQSSQLCPASTSVGLTGFSSETSGFSSGSLSLADSEICIICNNALKDSIFIHTNIGHRCCCYVCAKKIVKTTRRCPICNRTVNKVVKIYNC